MKTLKRSVLVSALVLARDEYIRIANTLPDGSDRLVAQFKRQAQETEEAAELLEEAEAIVDITD